MSVSSFFYVVVYYLDTTLPESSLLFKIESSNLKQLVLIVFFIAGIYLSIYIYIYIYIYIIT